MVDLYVDFYFTTDRTKTPVLCSHMTSNTVTTQHTSQPVITWLSADLLYHCHSDLHPLGHHHWAVWHWQWPNGFVHLNSYTQKKQQEMLINNSTHTITSSCTDEHTLSLACSQGTFSLSSVTTLIWMAREPITLPNKEQTTVNIIEQYIELGSKHTLWSWFYISHSTRCVHVINIGWVEFQYHF